MGVRRDRRFTEQAHHFIACVLADLGEESLAEHRPARERAATALRPVVVEDGDSLSPTEVAELVAQFHSPEGVAYFVLLKEPKRAQGRHELFALADQLEGPLNLRYALRHPLEGHPEAIARFGPDDGTVKVYDLPKPTDRGAAYREVGETSEMFSLHHDGLGSAGAVETVFLYADGAPLWGGFTFFQNVCRLALDLAQADMEAFEALFLPDALTILRPRGKGALRVTTPVLYLNEIGRPQSAFRRQSGEYQVSWRETPAGLARAAEFLREHTGAFAGGSSFVHFSQRGEGCLIRNEAIAHGRSDFLDSPERGRIRVLSRKWFMRSEAFKDYRHVPGMSLKSDYAALYPEIFGPAALEGEWLFDSEQGKNIRIS